MLPVGRPISHDQTKFQPVNTEHPTNPKRCPFWGPSYHRPYPTNTWWTNLVLDAGDQPIQTYPYLIKVQDDGFKLCYPTRHATNNFIMCPHVDDLILSAKEPLAKRMVTSHDELSVTVRYTNLYDEWSTMQSPIFRGQVYHTIEYENMTPVIRSVHAILKVNGRHLYEYFQPQQQQHLHHEHQQRHESMMIGGVGSGGASGGTVSTNRLKLEMNNGQTWIIYSPSSHITWNIDRSGSYIEACTPFRGVIRATLVLQSEYESTLDQFQSAYPVSSSVELFVAHTRDVGDIGTVAFRFETKGIGSIILFTLPHHRDVLRDAVYTRPKLRYRSIKGWCEAVIGDEWLMDDTLVQDIGFYSRFTVPTEKIPQLVQSLEYESDFVPTGINDTYFYGKAIAKLGRLAVIADELGERNTATKIRENMKQSIDQWLDGVIYHPTSQNDNKLMYEPTYGALVSKRSVGAAHAEFGQYYMNDHHFHYGYLVYAAACIAKEDLDWGRMYRSKVLELVRDYANPSKCDPQYPYMRCKDWYTGHSFASGLFAFADSKNQESSSEAVNAYYAIYLLGLVFNDDNLTNVGRLLMQTEIRSARKYWQIPEQFNDIYEPEFSRNRVVGVLWETKVDYATFFGRNVEYIHGIQMLPFTPITEDLLDVEWIRAACLVYGQAFRRMEPKIEEGWKGFLLLANSMIDKEGAESHIENLTAFDDGNSRTNSLYYLYTRPGFDNYKRHSIYSGCESQLLMKNRPPQLPPARSPLTPPTSVVPFRYPHAPPPLPPHFVHGHPPPPHMYMPPVNPVYGVTPPSPSFGITASVSPPPPPQQPTYSSGYPDLSQPIIPPASTATSTTTVTPAAIAVYPGVIVYKRERLSTRARKMFRRAKKEFIE